MLKRGPGGARSTFRRWSRARIQLGGGLLFAVLMPLVLLTAIFPDFWRTSSVQLTIVGAAGALVLSVYLMRTITLYPGIRGAFYVMPIVMLSFGVVFSLFLFFRLDYSRVILVCAGASTLIWLYLVQSLIDRGPPLKVGVVPIGDVEVLREVPMLKLCWLDEAARRERYDVLVADFHADLSKEWEAFLADRALSGVPVFHVKQLHESLTGRVMIEHLSENSFGSLIPFMAYLRVRRVLDFIAALIMGVLLLPLFILVAVLIKLDSPGPVLFRQVRIGYRGAPFHVAKFRTMVNRQIEKSEALNDAMTKDNDTRITRLGRVLRRTRIDELPQIWNILKGEMSWIGPRPEAAVLSQWYEAELPFYRYRHIVPPGVTGWAQVNQGHVFDLNQVTSKLHYDFYYIKNFSPWLDALIVVKTIQTIVTGFGSR